MENTCVNIQTNNKQTFKNLISDKNREKFFNEFLEDESTKYVINGLGKTVVLSKDELVSLIHNNDTKFEIVNPYDEYCTMIINGLPITIEYF